MTFNKEIPEGRYKNFLEAEQKAGQKMLNRFYEDLSKTVDETKSSNLQKLQEYEMSNTIEHPKHYGGENDPYEAIKVIEAWGLGFHLGNVIKYLSRAGKKSRQTLLEDLRKAKWYLERYIDNLEEELRDKKPEMINPKKSNTF